MATINGLDIHHEIQGEGPPIVFVHGALVNANLWRKVVPALGDELRCVCLDMPFGAHVDPLPRDADLSPPAVADLVADAIDALGLDDVTLVGNDTGGAICQLVITRRPERIVGRRVDLLSRSLDVAPDADPIESVRAWLRHGREESARRLAEKAVVLIEPRPGSVIWP